MRRKLWLCVILWAWCVSVRAAEQPEAVFKIGVADGDFRELAIAGNIQAYAKQFPNDVDFEVGKSDPKQDWPFIHPGAVDAWAGNRTHGFKIHFQIAKPADTYYRLAIDYINTHPTAPPVLSVDIN